VYPVFRDERDPGMNYAMNVLIFYGYLSAKRYTGNPGYDMNGFCPSAPGTEIIDYGSGVEPESDYWVSKQPYGTGTYYIWSVYNYWEGASLLSWTGRGKIDSVKSPSKMVIWMESYYFTRGWNRCYPRHLGGLNVLYIDGHAFTHNCFPDLDGAQKVQAFGLFEPDVPLSHMRGNWGVLHDRRTPTWDRIIAEKDQALQLAREIATRFAGIAGDMPETSREEIRRHLANLPLLAEACLQFCRFTIAHLRGAWCPDNRGSDEFNVERDALIRLADEAFVQPVVARHSVHLHPMIFLLSLMLGGKIFGFVGLLFAVPAACVIKALIGVAWDWYVSEAQLGPPHSVEGAHIPFT